MLSAGDVIETQAGAQVVLEFSDGSLLELGENTKLDFAELSQAASGARVSRVKLAWGWLRAHLAPGHQGEGAAFEVETPNALIGVKFSQPQFWVGYDRVEEKTVGLAESIALEALNTRINKAVVAQVGSTVIVTNTTITVVAGLLSTVSIGDKMVDTKAAAGTEAAETAETAETGMAGATTAATTSGLSTTTITLIGVGAAVAAGGVAAIAAGGGGDGGGSGANDSFTGIFVTQNHDLGEWDTITFDLSQQGNSITGSYHGELGAMAKFTFSVSGTASGLSADLTCYNGQIWQVEIGSWYPLRYEIYATVTLINNGSILRMVSDSEMTDFIRQ